MRMMSTERIGALLTEFRRYAILGAGVNLVGYLVYLGVTFAGVEPKIAVTVLYAAAATVTFIGNRKWTFGHKGSVSRAGVKYLLSHLAGYALNLLILIVFFDLLGLPHQIVQAAAIAVVAACLFLSSKYIVFRNRDTLESRSNHEDLRQL